MFPAEILEVLNPEERHLLQARADRLMEDLDPGTYPATLEDLGVDLCLTVYTPTGGWRCCWAGEEMRRNQ